MTKETILLVEDDKMSVMLFRKILERWKYRLCVASTGEEAIRTAAEVQPDLILMDIQLMGMLNGVKTAEQIRARSDIPIIYLTAYADEALVQQAKMTRPYGYLVKPVQPEELRSTIAITLYKHQLDQEYRGRLEKLVEERTAELKQAHDKLHQAYETLQHTQAQLVRAAKLASIGELAAGVTHELNQPLMVIRANTQMIRRSLAEEPVDTENLPKLFELIERNTKRMMMIVNHLKTFARQIPLKYNTLQVNQVIENVFLLVSEHLRSHDILIQKELTVDLPSVVGNAIGLEQVLLNVIANARNAIDAKGDSKPGQIDIVTRISGADPEYIEILVKDTGKGIAAEHLDKIFDPFFTTREIGEGVGLGLSISYGIVKEHQGEITVVETGQEGTMLSIRLPIGIDN